MTILERAMAPTPLFFKKLRTIGLILATIAAAIAAAPVALPAAVVSFAGYAALAGAVISAVSQITVSDNANPGLTAKPTVNAGLQTAPAL